MACITAMLEATSLSISVKTCSSEALSCAPCIASVVSPCSESVVSTISQYQYPVDRSMFAYYIQCC